MKYRFNMVAVVPQNFRKMNVYTPECTAAHSPCQLPYASTRLGYLEKFLLRESPKKETAGINVQAAVWPDPSACIATRIQIHNHRGSKHFMKVVQSNVCHIT
jgi:predicted metal-dependent TIM-barrel fold hydrolase